MLSLLRALNFGEKVTAVELGRIRTQEHDVGIEGDDRCNSLLVARDYISRIAQHGDDLLPECIVGFHHQQFPSSGVHSPRLLGWCETVARFTSTRFYPRSRTHRRSRVLLFMG